MKLTSLKCFISIVISVTLLKLHFVIPFIYLYKVIKYSPYKSFEKHEQSFICSLLYCVTYISVNLQYTVHKTIVYE